MTPTIIVFLLGAVLVPFATGAVISQCKNLLSRQWFPYQLNLFPFNPPSHHHHQGKYEPGYLPLEIRANNCDGDYCQFSISANILFEFDAITRKSMQYSNTANLKPWSPITAAATDSLNTYLFVDFDEDGDVLTGVDLPESSYGCNGLTVGACPLAANVPITWRLNWAWDPQLLSVGDKTTVQLAVYDDNENTVTCFSLPVEIVA